MASTTTLTLSGLTLADAQEIAGNLEEEPYPPLAVSINETDESRGLWNVVAYYPDLLAAKTAGQKLAGSPSFQGEPQFEAIPETGWVEKSLKALGPVTAGRFFLHGAHDRARRRSRIGGISLEIDAGTAFGTGHHATTIGCLLAFERLCKRRQPRNVLDVGTGTGILAMAAAKAIHRLAIASDIDPEAVRVARHNVAVNGLRPWIRAITAVGLRHPMIAKAAPYDLIFANILARPLIVLAPDITDALAPGGRLILSGLTGEQMRSILVAYRNRGLVLESSIRIGQWPTLTLAKTRKRPGRKGAGRISRND